MTPVPHQLARRQPRSDATAGRSSPPRLRPRPLAQRRRLGIPRREDAYGGRGVAVDRGAARGGVQPAGAHRLSRDPAAGDDRRQLRALARGGGDLARAPAGGEQLPELPSAGRGRLPRLSPLPHDAARGVSQLWPLGPYELGRRAPTARPTVRRRDRRRRRRPRAASDPVAPIAPIQPPRRPTTTRPAEAEAPPRPRPPTRRPPVPREG